MRRATPALLFIIVTALFPASECAAQYRKLTFEQISIEQGLSQSIVFCIMQDRAGFMWFATEDGLNKYDGYDFSVLRHDPQDSSSLSYNEIRALHEDRSGMLWIGTFYGGLSRYDPHKDRLTHYRTIRDDPSSLSHNNVKAIYEDRFGMLWIGTEGGLNRFDRATEKFMRFQNVPDDPASLSDNVVNAMCEDRAGNLWIGTDRGLDRLVMNGDSASQLRFVRYQHHPDEARSLSHDVVTALLVAHDGSLWIGTRGGLNRMAPAAHDHAAPTFTRYLHDRNRPQGLSHNDIRALYEDRAGMLWIGTNGGGLNLFDRAKQEFLHYQNDPRDPSSLSYNEIYEIFEDRSGIMWLGTYGGGVNKVSPRRKPFALYQPDPEDANSLPEEIVWSIYEDGEGILWIGTHGGGLTRFDRAQNRYENFQNDPRAPASLGNNIVRLVYPSRTDSNILWIGTHGGGLNKFDKRTKKITRYVRNPDDPESLSHDELRALYEDHSGVLWIGTNGGGLNQAALESNNVPRAFKRYGNDPRDAASLSNDFVRVIYEDPDEAGKFLWIGTQGGGLNKLDRQTGTFTHYRAQTDNAEGLNNDYIFCIHEDDAGLFWLGTWGGGINRFDRRTEKFKAYTTREGLPSNEVYGILADEEGNLWLSSNQGLAQFNPRTETFKRYNVEDGLQSSEFNGGAFFKSTRGEMFFGGIHGFNAFYPKDIQDNKFVPPVVLTRFLKLNKEARLERPLAEMQELRLSYKDYVFAFEFAALDFTAPMKNQYAYKMEGLDHEWIYAGAKKRSATYTTLSPGNYVFRVKGSNNDGLWNETGAAIKITISPPWWKTWWARTAAVLLGLGLAYLGYRRRVKHVLMQSELRAAHHAQMSIMPHADPEIAGFDISGVCLPANEVGGDFYDYFWLDENQTHFGIAVGDVSGKAMQSAITAVLASGMIYAKAEEQLTVNEMMTQLNRRLFGKTERNMFTALCLAALNRNTKTLNFTNAGLIEPLLKRDGAVLFLQAKGTSHPLGIKRDNVYEAQSLALHSGDVLLFITDGITEELNRAREFYGEERLQHLFAEMDTAALTAHAIKTNILAEIKRFSGATPQDDDMTIVVVKVL